jgi:hypothetical protein
MGTCPSYVLSKYRGDYDAFLDIPKHLWSSFLWTGQRMVETSSLGLAAPGAGLVSLIIFPGDRMQ